jgi:hypothetical protein
MVTVPSFPSHLLFFACLTQGGKGKIARSFREKESFGETIFNN